MSGGSWFGMEINVVIAVVAFLAVLAAGLNLILQDVAVMVTIEP